MKDTKKRIERILLSGKTTGEVVAALDALVEFRKLKRSLSELHDAIYSTFGTASQKIDSINKQFDDFFDKMDKIKRGAN